MTGQNHSVTGIAKAVGIRIRAFATLSNFISARIAYRICPMRINAGRAFFYCGLLANIALFIRVCINADNLSKADITFAILVDILMLTIAHGGTANVAVSVAVVVSVSGAVIVVKANVTASVGIFICMSVAGNFNL